MRHEISFTNSLYWDASDTMPDRRETLRLASASFRSALSTYDTPITEEGLRWFKEELDEITRPSLLPGSSGWSGS